MPHSSEQNPDNVVIGYAYSLMPEQITGIKDIIEGIYGGGVCMTSTNTLSFFILEGDYDPFNQYSNRVLGKDTDIWFIDRNPRLANIIRKDKDNCNHVKRLALGLLNSDCPEELIEFEAYADKINYKDIPLYCFYAAKYLIEHGHIINQKELDYLKEVKAI